MSLNDPKWGKGGGDNRGGDGNQGPPDLDELWRDFNRRLSGMFGKTPGRGGGSGNGDGGGKLPEFNFRQFGGGIGLIAAFAAVIWLASGFYIVDASQRGIVLQFGRFQEATEPGLRWRLPYPTDESCSAYRSHRQGQRSRGQAAGTDRRPCQGHASVSS